MENQGFNSREWSRSYIGEEGVKTDQNKRYVNFCTAPKYKKLISLLQLLVLFQMLFTCPIL